jgi:hypothetical protein
MPLAAKQNDTKAMKVIPSSRPLSSTPAAPGAAKTRTFLSHCFGRMAFSIERIMLLVRRR